MGQNKYTKCPECQNITQADFPYCNYCGAKLENVKNETEPELHAEDTANDNSLVKTNDNGQLGTKSENHVQKKHKMKYLSLGFAVMVIIGIVLFIYGLTIDIPSDKLSYSGHDGTSQIEEYVGGDAYNYIIGAEIVGSKIVAAKTERAIFICVGLFMITLGAAIVTYEERKQFLEKSDIVEKTSNL